MNSAPAFAGIDDLSDCSQLEKVLPMADGSAVAAGSTWNSRNCLTQSVPDGQRILVRFAPAGLPDQAFGDGGVTFGPSDVGPVVDLLGTPDGGFLLVSEADVTKFDRSGHLDPGFADHGHLDPGSFGDVSGNIKGGQVKDGDIYLFQSIAEHPAIVKFHPNGTRNTGFGQDGMLKIPDSPWSGDPNVRFKANAFAIDPQGRLVLAGGTSIWTGPGFNEGYSATGVERLDSSGNPDSTFGPAPGGFRHLTKSECSSGCVYWADQIRFMSDGTLVILGKETHDMVKAPRCHNLGVTMMTTGGEVGPIPPHFFGNCLAAGATDLLPDGDVISPGLNYGGYGAQQPGISVSRFAVDDLTSFPYGQGVSVWTGQIGVSDSSDQEVLSAVRDPLRDQIVAVGYASSSVCTATCDYTRSMVMARFDQTTGDPVTSFGREGAIMLPGNRCPYGSVPGPSATPNWTRCRVRPPEKLVQARLLSRKTKKPKLIVLAAPGPPPYWFWGTTQTLRLHLPQKLGPVRINRLKVTLPGKGSNGVKSVSLNQRVLVVKYKADQGYCDYYYCSDSDPTIKFRIQFKVRNRAPMFRSFRRGTLRLAGSMTFTPSPGPARWWASSLRRFTVKVGT